MKLQQSLRQYNIQVSGFELFLHLDQRLKEVITQYGPTAYGILFLIVFAETGLVVTPFLPGDSLLFGAGIFAHQGSLELWALYPLFIGAALLGDNVNYFLGKTFGHALFKNEHSKIFKKSHLEKTHEFYERHGPMTVIIARFVPIVRTFSPFVAGMGAMPYRRFLSFSVIGACLWVGLCVTAGYVFGGNEYVKKHFAVAAIAIVGISLLPAIIEVLRHRADARKRKKD